MKKVLAIIGLMMLSGCSMLFPVSPEFPEAPKTLKEKCGPLNTLKDDAKLSDLMITITQNYMKYHDCSIKNDSWNEWYDEQKKIYDSATKK